MADVKVVVDEFAVHALLIGEGATIVTLAALKVLNMAKTLCPVDTGRLRNSITWELGLTLGVPTARIGTNVEYAPYVELGTRYMAAQAFLRPALAAVTGAVV